MTSPDPTTTGTRREPPLPESVCEDCSMRHEAEDKTACIEGHGADPLVDRLDQGWLSTDDIQVAPQP